MAGILADAFPRRVPAEDELPAWECDWTTSLRRYAEIFGAGSQVAAGQEILGIGNGTAEGRWQADLAADMADWTLDRLAARPACELRPRLPMIASWLASRLRAATDRERLPLTGPAVQEPRIEPLRWEEPYGAYFSVEAHVLRHRRYGGDWSPELLRAVFVSGDATVVLPWDPRRDRVLLIDQFRSGPWARGDAQPWLCETVAGRVDAGETPEEAALREGMEEAGLTISKLIPAPHHYPSPGAIAEFLYVYVGIADLPDHVAGIGGLASEDEDIRSHLVSRAELTRMALSGELRNGPLLMLALWLELNAERLMGELDGTPQS